MLLSHSNRFHPVASKSTVKALTGTIKEEQLREWVKRIAIPRHFNSEPSENRAVCDWLEKTLKGWGYKVERQGRYENLVAQPEEDFPEMLLVGAHYDSVPMCPGADDNASAVAAMLGCAAACRLWRPRLPVMFVAFNCEEDGLLGSRDFVNSYLPNSGCRITCAHILEMVGFASTRKGSQGIPKGLPVKMHDTGDFLGLLANGSSRAAMRLVLRHAGTYAAGLPVTGLHVMLGMEKVFPVLSRSDHAPFWEAKLPAVMWTDTSEFRNPHYHRLTDTPETLDYTFLRNVTQLLSATVVEQGMTLLGE